MSGITFTGIGSGLQVTEIVNAIVNSEKAPFETRSARQQGAYSTDISAVGALKSALEEVTTSLENLGKADQYQLRTASGRDDFIGITADKDAQVGSYEIKVDSLAKSHKLISAGIASTDPVGEGKLTIESGSNNFEIDVSATNTISEIRDLINNKEDNDSVVATIITDASGQHLVLSSKKTGEANAIKITVDDLSDGNGLDNIGLSRLAYDPDVLSPTFAKNLTEVDAATDAQITIDNSIIVKSSTNEFENVIDGISISARKVQGVDDDNSRITITENNNNVASGLASFVEKFNALVDLTDQLGKSSDGQVGVLAGDSLIRSIMTKIRGEFNKEHSSSDDATLTLKNLGITTERSGYLTLDKTALNAVINKDPDAVQNFFVGKEDGKTGFVASMDTFMGFYTKSDGIIQKRIDGKNQQIDRLNDDLEKFTLKMESLESRLYAQYNAMDLLVSQMNATSSFVMAQLENLPGVVKKDK